MSDGRSLRIGTRGSALALWQAHHVEGLIKAQQQYIRALLRARGDEATRNLPLQELISGPLQMGWVNYYAPYEDIHQANMKKVMAS